MMSGFQRDVNEIFALLGFTQRSMVVPYRRFGTTQRPHLQGSSSPRRTHLIRGVLYFLVYSSLQSECSTLFAFFFVSNET